MKLSIEQKIKNEDWYEQRIWYWCNTGKITTEKAFELHRGVGHMLRRLLSEQALLNKGE